LKIYLDWGRNFVDLEWTPPKKDGGSEITSYIIEKREKYGFVFNVFNIFIIKLNNFV